MRLFDDPALEDAFTFRVPSFVRQREDGTGQSAHRGNSDIPGRDELLASIRRGERPDAPTCPQYRRPMRSDFTEPHVNQLPTAMDEDVHLGLVAENVMYCAQGPAGATFGSMTFLDVSERTWTASARLDLRCSDVTLMPESDAPSQIRALLTVTFMHDRRGFLTRFPNASYMEDDKAWRRLAPSIRVMSKDRTGPTPTPGGADPAESGLLFFTARTLAPELDQCLMVYGVIDKETETLRLLPMMSATLIDEEDPGLVWPLSDGVMYMKRDKSPKGQAASYLV